jgi:hypothetical protein
MARSRCATCAASDASTSKTPDAPRVSVGAALDCTGECERFRRRVFPRVPPERAGAGAHVVGPGSMFLASPTAGRFSAEGVAVPIGAAREFGATYRRTVGARHAELRPAQTTPVGLSVPVWVVVPPCKTWLQDGRRQPHGRVCGRCARRTQAEPGQGAVPLDDSQRQPPWPVRDVDVAESASDRPKGLTSVNTGRLLSCNLVSDQCAFHPRDRDNEGWR